MTAIEKSGRSQCEKYADFSHDRIAQRPTLAE